MSISIAVDTAATFSVTIFMGCEPKADFNTGEHQRNAAGLPKWGVNVATQTVPVNGQRSVAETISVTIPSESNPAEGLAPGTPVELVGLRCGVMDPEQRGEKIRGGRQFWQAAGIRARHLAAKS